MASKPLEKLTVGAGCFWCIEAIFNEIKGVQNVVSGFSGGNVPGVPTYREVCSGLTGHAEVVQVAFDPSVISYDALLLIFMTSHNPTTRNGQSNSFGSQYRSVIFYHNTNQKQSAKRIAKDIGPNYKYPITTEITAFVQFFEAEGMHQNYYSKNKTADYCRVIIEPKLDTLRHMYFDKLKNSND